MELAVTALKRRGREKRMARLETGRLETGRLAGKTAIVTGGAKGIGRH